MIKRSIILSEEVYNKAKAAAIMRGKNLMMPDAKTNEPSWAEDAFKEKLERES